MQWGGDGPPPLLVKIAPDLSNQDLADIAQVSAELPRVGAVLLRASGNLSFICTGVHMLSDVSQVALSLRLDGLVRFNALRVRAQPLSYHALR